MSEIALGSQFEVAKPKFAEQTSFGKKVQNIVRRLMHYVKRPPRESDIPEQLINPKGLVKQEKQRNPERARRIGEQGCVVRSIMSAVAHATGEKNVTATVEEWDKRFQQVDRFQKGITSKEASDQEIINLYADYAKNDTPLGNALKQATIIYQPEETEDTIKARLRSGEQVLVITQDNAHMYHAGLNKKGQIISLSDQKVFTISGKKKYIRFNRFTGPCTTFSVRPK